MSRALTLIWETAGKPEVEGSKGKLLEHHPARCCLTDEEVTITAPASKALGTNFTDQSLWENHSGRVSQAGLWCCSGNGRKSPRMWSWICAPGENLPPSHEKAYISAPGLCLTNRSNTRPIIDTLLNPPAGPWVMCIAVSGQKHVLPYTRINYTRHAWTVRMEDQPVTSDPNCWNFIFSTVLSLRRMGVPAESIKAGRPDFIKSTEELKRWKTLADPLIPYARGSQVELALWCITKPIMEDTHAYPSL